MVVVPCAWLLSRDGAHTTVSVVTMPWAECGSAGGPSWSSAKPPTGSVQITRYEPGSRSTSVVACWSGASVKATRERASLLEQLLDR